MDEYRSEVLASRRAKDEYFARSPDSPFRCGGAEPDPLCYYDVDPRFRITVPRIRRMPSGERGVLLATSDGQSRLARRVAYLDFSVAGRPLRLTGFSMGTTPPGTLFVPFMDLTSGDETYAGGRYLDLEIEPDGRVVIDFNLAYQPYCAYSSAYSCPLTPPENRLDVPVRAGERSWSRYPIPLGRS